MIQLTLFINLIAFGDR